MSFGNFDDLQPLKGTESSEPGRERLHGAGLPISGSVLALIVAGAFFMLRDEPLQPSRPKIAEAVWEEEQVQARLWEDPFAAVDRHRGQTQHRSRHHRYPSPPISEQVEGPERLVVLGVMVFGGPYDEIAEGRLRNRHAVLSALAELDYEPIDSDHIDYFEHSFAIDVRGAKLIAPYEWLRLRIGDRAPLLLLWLNDDLFRPRPLARLGELIEQLRAGLRSSAAGRDFPIEFKVLGPKGSTNLRALALELGRCLGSQSEPCQNLARSLRAVEIFTPSATIAETLLPQAGRPGESLDDAFGRWTGGGRLLRTIGTDEGLAKALVEELRLRGVDTRSQGRAHVALISEWDTHYGRALPCAFMASARDPGAPDQNYPESCLEGSGIEEPGRIHRFSYLRGFDGQLPRPTGEREIEPTPSADQGSRRPAGIERPLGRRRLDYLRRLAGQLHRLDRDLARRHGGEGLQAIGVLGSDVFDKLVILQALRERFRRQIFFTTDLDASLLHPAEYRSTRNLVVVSNFGLELHENLQGKIPAFRDNYQTALFFSTRVALDPGLADDFRVQGDIAAAMEPRVFELGRSGAFDLSPGTSDRVREIHPPRTDHLVEPWARRSRIIIPVAAVLMAGFFLLYFRTYRERQLVPAPIAALRAVFAWILLAGALVLALGIAAQSPQGEPFVLFEGISVWPSLYLRYLAAVLSLYFLFVSWKRMVRSDAQLIECYLLKPAEDRIDSPAHSPRWRGLLRLARLRAGRLLRFSSESTLGVVPLPMRPPGPTPLGDQESEARDPKSVEAEELFRQYRQRGRLSRRLTRVLPLAAAYFALGYTVVSLLGRPNVPHRGSVSFLATQLLTLAFAVPVLLFLTFWVVDATKLSVWLTRALAGCKTRWPDATRRHFAKRLHLDPDLISEWLDIQVIARHSVTAGKLVYAPVIVIVLMIASRTSFFDNWDFPIGLCVVILATILYAIYCALILRRSAEDARAVALRHYREALIQAEGRANEPGARQIRLMIDQICNLRTGAFVPVGQQPWVRAVALLFGGGGSLVLLEYLVWLN